MIVELDGEEAEIFSARWENGSRPTRSAAQKRYDKLVRRISELKEQNEELRRTNSELQDGLARSLRLVDKLRRRLNG